MVEIVKIYVPTPTKKAGVAEVNAIKNLSYLGDYSRLTGYGTFWKSDADRTWFLDKNKALAAAEVGRLKRIASLKKQIEKLEKIGPFTSEA